MKRLLLTGFFILSLFFSHFTMVLAVDTYRFDPEHTYVLWRINHLGFSPQVGKFVMVEGVLKADEAKPSDSKMNVVIQMDKVVTGIPKLDEHLVGSDFFDVAKYPTATFVSNKVVKTGKDTGQVYGTLTLLGVSKPIVLDVKLLKQGVHPMKNMNSLGFVATAKIKRSDFGIKKYLPALGDDVQLEIGAEANMAE
jgi:polyisoprenoid-binding protein YceI